MRRSFPVGRSGSSSLLRSGLCAQISVLLIPKDERIGGHYARARSRSGVSQMNQRLSACNREQEMRSLRKALREDGGSKSFDHFGRVHVVRALGMSGMARHSDARECEQFAWFVPAQMWQCATAERPCHVGDWSDSRVSLTEARRGRLA